MLSLIVVGLILSCADVFPMAPVQPFSNVRLTVQPAEATVYAGEIRTFVATVIGLDDKSVTWAVQEDDGGSISVAGLYIAPKIQGVYHVTATSTGNPNLKAIATITVLAYYDPGPREFRP